MATYTVTEISAMIKLKDYSHLYVHFTQGFKLVLACPLPREGTRQISPVPSEEGVPAVLRNTRGTAGRSD